MLCHDYYNNDTHKNMKDAMHVKRLIIPLVLDRPLECFMNDNNENIVYSQETINNVSPF